MDSDLPFGYTHRQKRSHAQMELEGSASPTWSTFNRLSASREPSASASRPQHSSFHLPHTNNMPSALPQRFPGDGFDYRRPVTSSPVIDLTNDDAGPSTAPGDGQRTNTRPPRPPRFGRDIMRDVIDVDAEDVARAAAPPGSPEIEFVSSRRIDPPRRPNLPAFGRNNPDEDEVEFVSENPLPESRRRRNVDFGFVHAMLDTPEFQGQMPHLRARVERERRANLDRQRNAAMNRMIAHLRRGPHPPTRRGRGHIHGVFVTPNLNFGAVGFDMGIEFEDPDDGPVPPPPTYTAPEKAPEGFTRSPQEQDVLVCPNCQEELCIGESEQKRQVWIVKHCGHVYCGECTANRYSKKSAKGKEKLASPRTKTFKECVVEGCQKKVSNRNAMIQIFL